MECDQLGDAPSDLVTTKFSSSRLNLNGCFVVAVQFDANACFVVLFAFSNSPFSLQHVEEFFSSQATHVITDLPEEQIPTASSQSSSNLGPAPLSPWTPSPVTSTPISNRRLGPSSRAEAILSKVKQTAKVVNTVLEKAVQLQIQIWSYSKILAWLQKYHLKVGRNQQRHSDSKGKVSGLKPLVAPCIKLESSDASSKPYYFELKSWPSLHFEGRPGSSPFSSSAARAKTKKLAKRLDINPEPKKKEEAPPKPKRTRGFCEICNENFEGLELHLSTDRHVNFVNAPSNWTEVTFLLFNTQQHFCHV